MSRAKLIEVNGESLWFDKSQNSDPASVSQLELLADAEGLELDDLLDEGLNQGQVMHRLHFALHGDLIPPEVLERRRARKAVSAALPKCRICSTLGWGCEGSITRHHFIPRWLMKELENYQAYAARSKCTIPICTGRHRDLHIRSDKRTPKAISEFLTDDERKFARKMLDELKLQHPKIFDLISGGDASSYEYQLIRDYTTGKL